MSRTSMNVYADDGQLVEGYDYNNQAWVVCGKYVTCGHTETMDCRCYGKINAGKPCCIYLNLIS